MYFQPLSSRIGIFQTTQRGLFHIQIQAPTKAPWSWIYTMKMAEQAIFEIRQPTNWDANDFEMDLKGELKSIPDLSDSIASDALWDWLDDHLDRSILSALSTLPTGEYFLIKSPRIPRPSMGFQIGNGFIETEHSLAHIIHYSPYLSEFDHIPIQYSASVHSVQHAVAGHPMLSISIQRYTLERNSFGSLFFPLGVAEKNTSLSDRILIVPLNGELVIDFVQEEFGFKPSGIHWMEAAKTYICHLLTGAEPTPRRPKKT